MDDRLVDIIDQWFLLSGLLGGFAFTGMIQIISLRERTWKYTTCTILFGVATFSFLYAAFTQTLIRVAVARSLAHAESIPDHVWEVTDIPFLTSFLFTGCGIFALLAAIGLAGWLYSKVAGICTSVMATSAILAIISNYKRFADFF